MIEHIIDDSLARRDAASSPGEVKAYWSKQGFRTNDEPWLVEFELAWSPGACRHAQETI